MNIRLSIPLCFLAFISVTAPSQTSRPTPFNPDSARAYLHTLAREIGPRTMGSPGERRAMEFALRKFREFGIVDATIVPFTITNKDRSGSRVNTSSGTVVGIHRGTSGRCIVIGAHIDSAAPEIEGANDDGSGTAAVIELARVLSQRRWNSTIVFCLFGGEEAGLRGSTNFVATTSLLDSINLMLQVDMANGSPMLFPMYDVGAHETPRWLVRAAYEEFTSLGHSGLHYPLHFYTVNYALGGGASSDHQPFLEKGIPAIDFTSDVSDPIHTQQDSWAFFKPGGLERSGDLVYRLVQRFDGGVPPEKLEQYLTIQVGSYPIFIPRWALFGFIVLCGAAGLALILKVRPLRTELWKTDRPRIPGLKVTGAVLLIVLAGWLSEDVVSAVKGWRSSWYAAPSSMIIPGVLTSLLAALLLGRWMKRWNLSNDPYRYVLRMVVACGVTMLLFGFASLRLSLYPAFGLLLCSLAYLVRPFWLQLVLVMAGAYPTTRIVFNEAFDFVASAWSMIPAEPAWSGLAVTAGLTLFSTVLLLPYGLAIVGLLRAPVVSPVGDRELQIALRGTALLLGIAILRLLGEPAYSDLHARMLQIQQTIAPGADSVLTTVAGTDYVKDVVIRTASGDTGTTARVTSIALPPRQSDASRWVQISTSTNVASDSGTGMSMLVDLRTRMRPYTLTLTYEPRKARVLAADAGLLAVNATDRTASLRWYSFPDTALTIPLHLALSKPDTVTETVEATFVEQATPVSLIGTHIATTSRTVVRHQRSIIIP